MRPKPITYEIEIAAKVGGRTVSTDEGGAQLTCVGFATGPSRTVIARRKGSDGNDGLAARCWGCDGRCMRCGHEAHTAGSRV